MERLKDLFELLLKFDLINGEDDSALQISTEDNKIVIMKSVNKKKKPVWKRIENAETIGVDEFEQWLNDMGYEPYLYDTFLLSIDWVKTLIEAIEKVEPVIGEGNELEYMYGDALKSWEFILNSLSIARAIGYNFPQNKSWENIVASFRMWIDTVPSSPRTQNLFLSGTHFFWDMVQFFAKDRKLSDPEKLSQDVLEYKL